MRELTDTEKQAFDVASSMGYGPMDALRVALAAPVLLASLHRCECGVLVLGPGHVCQYTVTREYTCGHCGQPIVGESIEYMHTDADTGEDVHEGCCQQCFA